MPDYALNRKAASVAILRPNAPTTAQLRVLEDAELELVEGVVSPWPEQLGDAPTEAEINSTDEWAYHIAVFAQSVLGQMFGGKRRRPECIPPEYYDGVCLAYFVSRLVNTITHAAILDLQTTANRPTKTAEQIHRAALDVARALAQQ